MCSRVSGRARFISVDSIVAIVGVGAGGAVDAQAVQRQVMACDPETGRGQIVHRARAGMNRKDAAAGGAVEMMVVVIASVVAMLAGMAAADTDRLVAGGLARQVDLQHLAGLEQRGELAS